MSPYRSGLKNEANGGGANKAALSIGRLGTCPENLDRSQDLESDWVGIAKSLLALHVPCGTGLSDIGG